MATKKSTDTTEALRQLTYLAGALRAPRITEAAARLADHARDAGWTHEEYPAAVLDREVPARNASGAQLRIRAAGVLFATATEWVTRLTDAHRVGRLPAELTRLRRYGLIIVDEVGYLPFEQDAANLLFQLVSSRYEHGSLILTSNLPLSGRGGVLGDQAVGDAMIDRVVHHADVLTLEGASYATAESTPCQASKPKTRQTRKQEPVASFRSSDRPHIRALPTHGKDRGRCPPEAPALVRQEPVTAAIAIETSI